MEWIVNASAWVLPVGLAIILHEVAHGWVAERFGDNTARLMGRITLNPLKHVDPFGTVLLPAMMIVAGSPLIFGFAKPVPVDFSRLNPPRMGTVLVALAGPLTNVLLALLCGLLLHIDTLMSPEQAPWLFLNLYRAIMLNCGLAVFNMFPLLPLDGGRVVSAFLAGKVRQAFAVTERYGILIIFTLLLAPGMFGVNVGMILGIPVFALIKTVLLMTGNGS